MTEAKFTELVNLYLDKEISENGLAELKAELAASAVRKAEFRERCRLHQAMRLALNSGTRKRRSNSGRSRSSRSSRHIQPKTAITNRSIPRPRSISTRIDPHAGNRVNFPRWLTGTGVAACLAMGFILLQPVFRDTTSSASLPALEGVEAEELIEVDPLDKIGRAELRRFAAIQEQRTARQGASIAAQLRLMGLRPELTPAEKKLRFVSMAATQLSAPARNDAAFWEEVEKMTPMPAPQILRAESLHSEPAARWPGGFQSSLVSFQ